MPDLATAQPGETVKLTPDEIASAQEVSPQQTALQFATTVPQQVAGTMAKAVNIGLASMQPSTTPSALDSAKPGDTVKLTPEELQQAQPSGVDVFKELDAQGLADLQRQNPDQFKILDAARRRPDVMANPELLQKAADADRLYRDQTGVLEGVTAGGALENAVGFVKGLAKYGLTAADENNLVLAHLSPEAEQRMIDAGRVTKADILKAKQKFAEAASGTTSNLQGLFNKGAEVLRNFWRQTSPEAREARAAGHPVGQFQLTTPEQRVQDFLQRTEQSKQLEQIASGTNADPVTHGVGGAWDKTIAELQAAGLAPRPEEVAKYAAGDPIGATLFGDAFGALGKLGHAVTPGVVSEGLKALGDTTATVAGRTLQGIGTGATIAAKKALPVVSQVAAITGLVKGAQEIVSGQIVEGAKTLAEGGFGGLAAKHILTHTILPAAEKAAALGKKIATGEIPPGETVAPLIRDALQVAPASAAALGKGVAMDLGMAAAAETPEEKEGAVGLGTTFGALSALGRAVPHVISGQIVGTRDWGSNQPVNPRGFFPALDALSQQAKSTAAPGILRRINAVSGLVQALGKNMDFAFVPRPEAGTPDPLPAALQAAGVSPETANLWSQQDGLASHQLPNGKTLILARDISAAPHEAAGHGLENVLGESIMRGFDAAIQSDPQYSRVWDQLGQYYTGRLGWDGRGRWQDYLLDSSGWGRRDALEQAGQRAVGGQGPFTTEQAAQELTKAGGDWRNVLTPEQANNVANKYIAREIFAENADALFKNTGASLAQAGGWPQKIARTVGTFINALGGNVLAGRASEGLGIPLSQPIISQISAAGKEHLAQPQVAAAEARPRTALSPEQQTQRTQEVAQQAPDERAEGATMTQRAISDLLAQRQNAAGGVRLVYRSAPGEPAGAPAQNRATRRQVVEYGRTMPDDQKPLWQKLFFPVRAFMTGKGMQWWGWTPEVFAANANRVAQWAAETGNESRIPFEIDTANKTFTKGGWQKLYALLHSAFVPNQLAGRTGAGQPLVVPENVRRAGAYQPELGEQSNVPISQRESDFISMLFGTGQLPGSPRISTRELGLPGAIAGEEISAATQPGRVQPPVVPRGKFSGEKAEKLGIAGREIQEVNPVRAELEKAGVDAKVPVPKMIEAGQRLNLKDILHAESAPEQPTFGANPLTLQAGFLPKRPVELEGPDGKRYKATFDGFQDMTAIGRGQVPQFTAMEDLPGGPVAKSTTYGPTLEKAGYKLPPVHELSATEGAQFKPSDDPRGLRSAAVRDPETGEVFEGPFHAMAIMNAMNLPKYQDVNAELWNRFEHGFTTNGGEFLNRAEAWLRANELNQLQPGARPSRAKGGLGIEHLTMDALEDMRQRREEEAKAAQFSPKTFIVRHGSTEMNNADPEKDLIRGHINVPLDKKGRQEAQDTADQISQQGGVRHVIASDLGRTQETGRAIADKNDATFETDSGLRPWKFGPTIEGKPTAEMLPKIRELTENPDQRPEGGETFNEFKDRFLNSWHDAQAKYPDENTAVVTHYRGSKLLDAWRATGVDNDSIDQGVFEEYDKNKTPGHFDVVDKTGAELKGTETGQTGQFAPEKRPDDEVAILNKAGKEMWYYDSKGSLKNKRGLDEELGRNFWVHKSGGIVDAPYGHEPAATNFLGTSWEGPDDDISDTYEEMNKRGFAKVTEVQGGPSAGLYTEGAYKNWNSVPKGMKSALEGAAFDKNRAVYYNGNRVIDLPREGQAQYSPMKKGEGPDDILHTARKFWITREGETRPVWGSHALQAIQDLLPAGTPEESATETALARGHARGVLQKNPDLLDINGTPWNALPIPAQREIKRLSDSLEIPARYNGKLVETGIEPSPEVSQFKPGGEFQTAPEHDEFKDVRTLPIALAKPNWALFTATKEALGAGTDEVNKLANDNLEKALIADGFNPIPVQDSYKGIDQGKNFLVPGMTREQAQEWGKKYGQESVLTPQGLLYQDGSLNPIKPSENVYGDAAKNQDFYSQIEGGPAFSLGIDFNRKITPAEQLKESEIRGPVTAARVQPNVARGRGRQRTREEGSKLSIEHVLSEPDMKKFAETTVEKFKTIPGFENVPTRSIPGAIREISRRLQQNIRFMFDRATEGNKALWRTWYDLAKKMTEEWGPEYGVHPHVVAAVNAKLSPQMDWYNNVTLTRAVFDTVRDNPSFTENDRDFLRSKIDQMSNDKERNAFSNELADMKIGQKLDTMNDAQAALMMRAHNEMTRSLLTHDHNLKLTGDFTGWSKSFDELRAVMSIIRNPSFENVDRELGGNHKVRSFYNNHVSPESADWTTVDTHAVAAATLMPYGSKDKQVIDNFGNPKHAASGYRGTYWLYQHAYEQVAKEVGMLPREVQSIVWEQMRAELSPEAKRAIQALKFKPIRDIHKLIDQKKITAEEGRKRILDIFAEYSKRNAPAEVQQEPPVQRQQPEVAPSESYLRLLDATIGHLQDLKSRGVRYVPVDIQPLKR
jgi:broad specificity phosphatase PhoE